jgi:hypothetical protein
VFERHSVTTLIFDCHHSATSALVLSRMFFNEQKGGGKGQSNFLALHSIGVVLHLVWWW